MRPGHPAPAFVQQAGWQDRKRGVGPRQWDYDLIIVIFAIPSLPVTTTLAGNGPGSIIVVNTGVLYVEIQRLRIHRTELDTGTFGCRVGQGGEQVNIDRCAERVGPG